MELNSQIESVLRKLEDLNKPEVRYWNVPRSTALVLHSLVRIVGAREVLEIGTSTGYSGIFLADAVRRNMEEMGDGSIGDDDGDAVHGEFHVYTVESHEERFGMAARHFEEAGVDDVVVQLKGHAPEILEEKLPRRLTNHGIDFAFFDATKMEYKSYFETVLPMMKPGGVIVADNCSSHSEDVQDFLSAVQEKGERGRVSSFFLNIDSGLLVAVVGTTGS